MNIIRKRLRQAKVSHISMRFYQFMFDCLICIVVSIILTRLIRVKLYFSIIPFLVLAAIALVWEFKEWNIIKLIQGRYSKLDERLQTALEAEVDNPIAQSLVNEVASDIDEIEDSTFIKPTGLLIRVSTLIMVSFILLTVGYLGLYYFDLNRVLDDAGLGNVRNRAEDFSDEFQTLLGERWEESNYTTEKEEEKLGTEMGGDRPGYSEGPIPGTGGGVGSDAITNIYGEASSASLYGRDINFQLHPEYGGNIEIRETGQGSENPYFSVGDAESVEACKDCQVGPEHEELVRKYFQKITES